MFQSGRSRNRTNNREGTGGGTSLCLPPPSRISLRKPRSLSDILSPTLPHKHTGMSASPSMVTCVIRWAHARVVVDPIHTGGIVLTVVVLTVIRVDLTPLSLEAQRAGAASGVCVCRAEGIPGSERKAGRTGDRKHNHQVSLLAGGLTQHNGR